MAKGNANTKRRIALCGSELQCLADSCYDHETNSNYEDMVELAICCTPPVDERPEITGIAPKTIHLQGRHGDLPCFMVRRIGSGLGGPQAIDTASIVPRASPVGKSVSRTIAQPLGSEKQGLRQRQLGKIAELAAR